MIVYPGDLFDRLLFLTTPNLEPILMHFGRVLRLAKKHDIVIRILEGTPGHDHKQSYLFTIVNNLITTYADQIQVDCKHVTELSIEHLDKFNIDILYVPDEWSVDVLDTYNQATQLMRERNLEQVDFCLLHGAFNYQIDATLNPKAHNESLWSSIVRYYIFAGHVHFASQFDNILVAGSFDRLAHGEEQPKGYLTLEITEAGEHLIRFHENTYATIYKTIDVREKPLDEVLELVDTHCKVITRKAHIRLYTHSRDAINDGLKTLKQRYPQIFFTIKVDTKEKKQRTLQIVSRKFDSITLDKESIRRLMLDRVATLPHVDSNRVISILDRYL